MFTYFLIALMVLLAVDASVFLVWVTRWEHRYEHRRRVR